MDSGSTTQVRRTVFLLGTGFRSVHDTNTNTNTDTNTNTNGFLQHTGVGGQDNV